MNQKEINNTVVEMKNYFDGLTSGLDIAEKRNNKCEGMSVESNFPNCPSKGLYKFTFPSAECIYTISYTFTQTGYLYLKKLNY